ncbi:MAG: hypothetical protein GY946_00290, partial [bacterium]|nr:hypothetical protein [bacterium]
MQFLSPRLFVLSILAALGIGSSAAAATITATFTDLGATSNWNDAANWSTVFVPNNGNGSDDYDVVVDGDTSRLSDAFASTDFSILSLRLDANLVGLADSLALNNTSNLTLTSGGVQNDGRILFNSAGSSTGLIFDGSQSITGSGEIVMGNNSQNEIRGTAATGTIITHGANHTIRGAGDLLDDSGGMINQGTIRAEGTYQLQIDPETGQTFQNDGTMEAAGT